MTTVGLPVLIAAAMVAGVPLPAPTGFATADLEGEWHVQANIPYLLERNRVAPTLRFVRRADGKWDELYTARKGGFDAPSKTFRSVTWAPDPAQPWNLRTRLFFVILARYSVLELDREQGLALLGTEDRDKAWVLSRQKAIDETTYRRLVDRLVESGFERGRIQRIAQQPSDLGKPGYAPVED